MCSPQVESMYKGSDGQIIPWTRSLSKMSRDVRHEVTHLTCDPFKKVSVWWTSATISWIIPWLEKSLRLRSCHITCVKQKFSFVHFSSMKQHISTVRRISTLNISSYPVKRSWLCPDSLEGGAGCGGGHQRNRHWQLYESSAFTANRNACCSVWGTNYFMATSEFLHRPEPPHQPERKNTTECLQEPELGIQDTAFQSLAA